MLGQRHIKTLVEGALAACKEADQAEVLLTTEDSALTRFANNTIHQNVAERNSSLHVRVVIGKRIGVATANSLEAQAIRETAESACTIARFSEEDADFESLSSAASVAAMPEAFSDATASVNPEQRAEAVRGIIRQAEQNRLNAAGAFSTSCDEIAVANSLGVFAYQPSTSAEVTAVVMGETSSGYADRAATDAKTIDVDEVGLEACSRATRGANPRNLDPGEYPVVLEPYAVAEMLDYLAYVGFGAVDLEEGRSFMAEKLGQIVTGASISIYDDGLDLRCFPMPFDFEGVPRRRVELITHGTAKGVVYDSLTASRHKVANTGHALPAPNPMGPMPGHLHLAPGVKSLDELVRSLDRGLLVTRFHYVNVVQPLETIITGMTRDGAWWVEGGEVRYPVKNLRFSQNVLQALGAVQGIGRDLKLQRGWFGGSLVPALGLGAFNFTGKTEF